MVIFHTKWRTNWTTAWSIWCKRRLIQYNWELLLSSFDFCNCFSKKKNLSFLEILTVIYFHCVFILSFFDKLSSFLWLFIPLLWSQFILWVLNCRNWEERLFQKQRCCSSFVDDALDQWSTCCLILHMQVVFCPQCVAKISVLNYNS